MFSSCYQNWAFEFTDHNSNVMKYLTWIHFVTNSLNKASAAVTDAGGSNIILTCMAARPVCDLAFGVWRIQFAPVHVQCATWMDIYFYSCGDIEIQPSPPVRELFIFLRVFAARSALCKQLFHCLLFGFPFGKYISRTLDLSVESAANHFQSIKQPLPWWLATLLPRWSFFVALGDFSACANEKKHLVLLLTLTPGQFAAAL